jgi:hypothetical protein
VITVGATLNFTATVYGADPAANPGTQPVNAATAALTISLPPDPVTGVSATVSPVISTPATAGQYAYSYLAAAAGRYVGVWTFGAVGGNTSTYVQTFDVEPADPGYLISLAAAKRHLNIPSSDISNDVEILDWLAGITPVVEDIVGVCTPRVVVDHLAGNGRDGADVIQLKRTPVLSVVSMTPSFTYGRTYAASEFTVTSEGRLTLNNGWRFWAGPWTVTYVAGRTPLPANVIQAVKLILAHLWVTQRGAAASPYLGGDDVSVVPGFGWAIPNRALDLLKPNNTGPGVG